MTKSRPTKTKHMKAKAMKARSPSWEASMSCWASTGTLGSFFRLRLGPVPEERLGAATDLLGVHHHVVGRAVEELEGAAFGRDDGVDRGFDLALGRRVEWDAVLVDRADRFALGLGRVVDGLFHDPVG